MQTDKFTALVRNAVMTAQNDALAANHQKVTAMHLLRALLAGDNVTFRSLVGRAGGDIDGLSAALDKSLAAIPAVTGSGADQLTLPRRRLGLLVGYVRAEHTRRCWCYRKEPDFNFNNGDLLVGAEQDQPSEFTKSVSTSSLRTTSTRTRLQCQAPEQFTHIRV